GALPEDVLVGGRCALDWLGPVATAAGARWGEGAEKAGGAIAVTLHDGLAKAGRFGAAAVEEGDGMAEEIRARRPLDDVPARDAVVEGVIHRLTSRYTFEALTAMPALVTV